MMKRYIIIGALLLGAITSAMAGQSDFEEGFRAGYVKAYTELRGHAPSSCPAVPKAEEGADNYITGYQSGVIAAITQ